MPGDVGSIFGGGFCVGAMKDRRKTQKIPEHGIEMEYEVIDKAHPDRDEHGQKEHKLIVRGRFQEGYES